MIEGEPAGCFYPDVLRNFVKSVSKNRVFGMCLTGVQSMLYGTYFGDFLTDAVGGIELRCGVC